MKIAFLNMYNGLVDRGAETFVKEVAERLSKKHEVSVFQSGEALGSESFRVERIPLEVDLSRTGRNILSYLFFDYANRKIFTFFLKAARQIIREKFDVVIPINGGFMPAIVRLATWLSGGKMVISGQAGMGWDERNNLWCFPDVFVALSSLAKAWAKRINPFVKVVRIPNGVDTTKFSPMGEKLKTSLKKPIVLCVGALTKAKRIDLTIKAVSLLERASLLVVGDGELRSEINSLGRRLLGSRFELIKLPHEEMPKAYRVANVFTLASEPFHAFEIVLVEAMASGLSVVANKDDIRREIVGRAGVLVDAANIEAYAVAIENALRINWGKRPLRQANKFDWDKIAASYEKLFLKLCSR
ncbi:MAG: glycosyltransferase family 4 protein [Patescibacteria group bacterium]